jgi:hypothetical protein
MDIRIWNLEIIPAKVRLNTVRDFKSNFLGDVCPYLTNWYGKILSKNNKEEYYEYQADETKTNDGGST